MASVKAECSACGATGLYCGFAEPKGTAVVCLVCGGTGWVDLKYTPFEKRKGRKDVQWVSRSRGSLIVTGVGPAGRQVSYDEFEHGKMP